MEGKIKSFGWYIDKQIATDADKVRRAMIEGPRGWDKEAIARLLFQAEEYSFDEQVANVEWVNSVVKELES